MNLVDWSIIYAALGVGTVGWLLVASYVNEQLRQWRLEKKRKEKENAPM